MLKLRVLLCILALTVTGVTSCIFDPDTKTPPVVPDNPIKDLTHKEDVIYNMETAYNTRRIDVYDGVLDDNFTFFLSPGDVGGGLPEQWDRTVEKDVNQKLFDKNNTTLPCQSIFMDIRAEEGVSWTQFNPASAPSETWYSTTLFYDFKIQIDPNTYIPLPGAKAVFTVRDAGPHGKYAHHWQLVEFRDLGGNP